VLDKNTISFALGDYNSKFDLIIDPQLVFGTYSGSSVDNWGFTATYDQEGNTYSAGVVFGIGYPVTTGAWQQNFADGTGSRPCDIGIIKFSAQGQRLFATYLGGVGNEIPQSLVVSPSNELFVLGTTGSSDFATSTAAFQKTFKGGPTVSILRNGISFPSGTDVFVARFSDSGSQLLASTFLGGTGNDGLNTASQLKYNYADDARGGISVDRLGSVIIGTSTGSFDFPITGSPIQQNYGGGLQDGIVAKLNENLSQLLWSTYLGGSQSDGILSLELDRSGNAWVSGGTVSLDYPVTAGAYSTSNAGGQADGFISGIKANGQQLLASTYYGSDAYDQNYQIALDRNDRVYVFGQTEKSGNFFRENFTFGETNGKQFVSKFSTDLSSRIWSTTFGRGAAKPDITPSAFTVDICGQLFMAGWGGASNTSADGSPFGGTSGLTVTPDAFQSTTDNNDFYFMVLDEQEQSLLFASFFGGPTSSEHVDGGTSRFDKRGIMHLAVCAGCGGRDDFPTTPGVWSNVNGSTSGCNNAVFKFDFQLPVTRAAFTSPTIGCAPFAVDFSNSSFNATSYNWLINGTAFSSDENPTFSFNTPGNYTISLIAQNPETCNGVDTFYKQIRVVNSTFDIADSLSICLLDDVTIGPTFPIDPYYQPQWNPTLGLQSPQEQTTLAAPESNTQYTLILSLETCADTIQQYIEVRSDSIDAGPDLEICRGQLVQIGDTNVSANYTYNWTPTLPLNDATLRNPQAAVDETTTFYVLRIPPENTGACPGRDSLRVIIPEGSPLAIFDTEIIASCTDIKVKVLNTSELADSSFWNFGNGFFFDANPSPEYTYSYGDSISIGLIVTNPNCRDTLNFLQPTEALEDYYKVNDVNVFSPNADGKNDCFSPALQDLPAPDDRNFIPCSKLTIFDRWGLKIWGRSESADGCWDGRNETGEEMPDGTYLFLFEGQGKNLQGTVLLLR
jgi:gliding motility-associated-like protein